MSSPSDATLALVFLLSLLVPFGMAGLVLLNCGLGRARAATHTVMASLCVTAIAALICVMWGFAFQGFADHSGRVLLIAGKTWSWLGAEPSFLRGMTAEVSPALLAAWVSCLATAFGAMIPLGTGSDRWRLGPLCISAALYSGITYPLFAHWAWGGGWLSQLGANFGLGRGFLDAGGGATIHITGGLSALAIAWILGPRRGKYGMDGIPQAIPGHNAVYVLIACLLGLAGWIGMNGAAAILYSGVESRRVIVIAINTLLSAGSAGLASAFATRLRYGRPDASLFANGWFGGLVAISAGCAHVPPAAAVFIGLGAGALVPLAVEMVELHLSIDDPAGAISVHFLAGMWGLFAAGPFTKFPNQTLAQICGAATLLGFVLPLTYGLNLALDRFLPQRVSRDGERHGMDLHELGAGAYPEFMTHTDDFLR